MQTNVKMSRCIVAEKEKSTLEKSKVDLIMSYYLSLQEINWRLFFVISKSD